MNEQELKHYLSVLIELELFPMLRALTEVNLSIEELNNEQQKRIINFINGLPENYKNMSDRDEIIVSTLERMGMHTVWSQKKTEEIQMQKKLKKMQKGKQQTERTKEEQEK